MKKQLLVLTISTLVLATPAFAANNNEHSQGTTEKELHANTNHGSNNNSNNGQNISIPVLAETPEPSGTPGPTGTPEPTDTPNPTSAPSSAPTPSCDPSAEWNNHGKYVSCVAKLHLGGDVTSDAAKSDIGKKHQPSSSPSASPSASASATPQPTPPVSGPETQGNFKFDFDLGHGFQRIWDSFSHIFGFFHHGK